MPLFTPHVQGGTVVTKLVTSYKGGIRGVQTGASDLQEKAPNNICMYEVSG